MFPNTIQSTKHHHTSHSSTLSMASLLSLLLLSLVTFSLSATYKPPPPHALHLSVRKDPKTRQYYAELQITGTTNGYVNVVIDLGGQTTWFNCDNYNSQSYRPVLCNTNLCKTLKGSGCTNNTCGSSVYNPYRNLLYAHGYGTDTVTTSSTDGYYVRRDYDFDSYAFSCADDSGLLRNLAKQTLGMVGLARSKSSLPRQLSRAFKLPYKFALCLLSSSEDGLGDIFIGGGPYYTMPSGTGDLSKLLTTTPLLINPVSTAPIYTQGDPSDEYFIGIRSMKIDGKIVRLNSSLLSIDTSGNGGTKLSTIAPYTVLHKSIYRDFARAYVSAAASKNIKRVGSVKPFGVCFNGKAANGRMPHVDLVLQSESVKWRFNEPNLMVKVNNDVMCLGIRDGGLNPRTAIVLGGHQLENYLLEFDLVSSNLGFTSSLLHMNTSCASSGRLF